MKQIRVKLELMFIWGYLLPTSQQVIWQPPEQMHVGVQEQYSRFLPSVEGAVSEQDTSQMIIYLVNVIYLQTTSFGTAKYAINNSWKKEKELDQYVSLKMPD